MLNNSMFWKLIDIFTLFLEWIPLYILLSCLSKTKTSSKVRFTSFIIIIMISYSLEILGLSEYTELILCILLSMIFYKINYDVNLSKNLIVILVYFMIIVSLEDLSIGLVTTVNSINFTLLLDNNLYRLEGIILSKPWLLIYALYLKRHVLFGEIYGKDALSIGIIVCTYILSLLTIFNYILKRLNNHLVNNLLVIIILLLILLSSISLLIIIFKIIKNNNMELEYEIIKEKVNLEYSYYMKIENNQEKVKDLYHDMKNHIICISNLNDAVEIKKYIENIDIELRKMDNCFNTGNKIIDIIMSEKKAICIEKDIKFEAFIDCSKLYFVDMTDICIIFSNALDNAIQACDKINSSSILKYVSVKVTYVNSFCVINIENSKQNDIVKKNNIIVTDKKDKFMHGIGVKNIKNIINKYDGEVSINFTYNKFTLTMMIPVKNCPVLHS